MGLIEEINKQLISTQANNRLTLGTDGKLKIAQQTVFFTDFSLGTDGQPLQDMRRDRAGAHWNFGLFVRNSVASGVTGGKVLRNEGGSGTASREWAWAPVPATAYVEVLVKCRATTISGAGSGAMGCHARSSYTSVPYGGGDATAGGDHNGWGARLYYNGSATRFQLWNYVNSVFGAPVEVAADAGYASNVWMWIRLRIDATGVMARHWKDGNAEPGTWQCTAAHIAAIVPGTCGVYADTPSAIEEFDILSVALNGNTAASTGTPVMGSTAFLLPNVVGMTEFPFSSSDIGTTPVSAGIWTKCFNQAATWPVTDIGSGVLGLRSVQTAGDKASLLSAPLVSVATQEILCKMTGISLAANGNGVALRMESPVGPTADSCYCFEMDSNGLGIIKFTAGAYAAIADPASCLYNFVAGAGSAYWVRFRIQTQRMWVKVWRTVEPEPTPWMLTNNSDSAFASGVPCLYHYVGGTTVDYSNVYVKTT